MPHGKRVSSSWSLVIVSLALVLLTPLGVLAQTVQGRLDRQGPRGPYPAAMVAVTLNSPRTGRSAPTYTGNDGRYYFYRVPPGGYSLEVWGYGNQPRTFPIQVGNQPVTNVYPITVP
jgi:hypothetical protein